MKIGFVCDEYPFGPHGGIGTFTRALGRALAARGHEVRVVGIYGPGPWTDPDPREGVGVLRLPGRAHRLGWIVDRWRLYRAVARWSRSGQVDLVEVPDARGWAAFWPKLPVPVVCRLHGSLSYFQAEEGRRPDGLLYRLERASLARANFCCSVSQYTAERTQSLMQCPSRVITVLYNGVELPPCSATTAAAAPRVVFTGTLAPRKGVLSLARAWSEVARRCPEAELHWLGKDGRAPDGGSMQARLRTVAGAEAAGRMIFHGHAPQERVRAALQNAGAAVFPSYSEAFALAPMEAMACACPTIFTRRGSGPELIREGRDGLLVDPDDPGQIAAAILALLRDASLARRLGREGRRRVEESFAVGRRAAQNEEFYERCLRDFRRARA